MPNLLPHHVSRHLCDDEFLPVDPACPFCRSQNRSKIGTIQLDPEVELLRCNRCRAASASRFPTKATLDTYYRNEFFHSVGTSSADEQVTFENTERFGRHLARRLSQHVPDEAVRILDFGGGDGTLGVRVAEQLVAKGRRNIDVTVIDYQENLCQVDDERIRVSHCEDLISLSSSSRYQFVIASAVLEHISSPRAVISRLLNLVTPSGLFYARTPCVASFFRLFELTGMRWDFMFPAHVHDLGQAFWETLFRGDVTFGDLEILESRPSIVETSFRQHFFTSLAAYAFKAPWYLFRRRYSLVGGWEVFAKRGSGQVFGFVENQ